MCSEGTPACPECSFFSVIIYFIKSVHCDGRGASYVVICYHSYTYTSFDLNIIHCVSSVCSATQGSGQSPRSRRHQSRTAGGGKKSTEVKRNAKPSALGELIKGDAASSNSVPKKGTKEFKKRKGDDSPPSSQARHDSPVSCAKKAKTARDDNTDGLATCRYS